MRDGIQHSDQRPRQPWRCSAPDGTFHRFLGALSVTRVKDGVCPTCERHHGPAEGPSTPCRHDYLVREVVMALVAIGGGDSYTDVAERVKAQAWGEKRQWHRKPSTNINGGLVADRLQQYDPVVAEAHAETEWPDTLVLDSTEFQYTDSWTDTKSRLFCVLFAYGYPSDGTQPRLWKGRIESERHRTAMGGLPRHLAGQGSSRHQRRRQQHQVRGPYALVARSSRSLPLLRAPPLPEISHGDGCGQSGSGSPLHEALNHSFHNPEEWEALRDKVRELGSPALQRWMRGKSRMMATQLSRRGEIGVYSNGAIEAPIRTVRQGIERRAWCFRNRARMDLSLEMMRLRLNKVDSADAYSGLIRDHLTVTKGMPLSKRKQWDRRGTSSLRR